MGGSQCWRPCRNMNSDRTYFGSSVLNSRLHVFGGQNLDYKALCEMEIYDCLRDIWMVSASLNVPRRNCAGVALDGRIYAVGGFDGTNIISAVEAYDARMKNWMVVAPLQTGRSSAMAAVEDGKIFVLGGTCGSRLRTVEYYDPRMNVWEPFRADTIEIRSAGAAASCVNHLFVTGGTDNTQQIHYSAECLDMETCAWSFRKNMTVSRMDHACCVISDSILCGGGQNGDVLASTEFYRPELDEWQAGPAMLSPRYGHSYMMVNL